MNPWVKKDANVPVICRPSGDNRRDVVRYQVADGTEGWFCVAVVGKQGQMRTVAGSPKGKKGSKKGARLITSK